MTLTQTKDKSSCATGLSGTLFKLILDSLPQHIALMDDRANIIYVNRAWKIFGDANGLKAQAYCVGTNYMGIVKKSTGNFIQEIPEIVSNLERLLNGEIETWSIEYPCYAKDEKRWFKVTFNRIKIESHNWVVASHENVTQLWEINQDLIKNDQKLQGIIASIPEPMCMLDRSLNIVWSNEPAQKMFGKDNLSRTCTQAYGPESSFCEKCIVKSTFDDGQMHTKEMVLKDRHGNRRIFHCMTSVAGFDNQAKPDRVMEIMQDITEQKKMIRHLEIAKEQAESATLAKTNFLATMSHEIRTPMNAILGMSKLVLDSSLSDTQNRYVSNIHSAANSLLSIINDILDLTRIEGQKLELMERQFQLGTVIENIFTVLKYTAHDKDLELIYRHNHTLPLFLIGDMARISQILMNLMSNAVKYTAQGTVTVTSESLTADDGQHILCLGVEDTGIGMTQQQMTMLFQPFCQLDSSTSRKYGGTGLGLVIVKKMVEFMGGQIEVQSRPGKGSMFTLCLPLKKVEAYAVHSLPAKPLRDIFTVIVSADSPARQALVSNLTYMNLSAVTADNIQEAGELIKKQHQKSLVFLDCDAVNFGTEYRSTLEMWKHDLCSTSGCPSHLLVMHDHRNIARAGQLCRDISFTKVPYVTCLEKPITPITFLKTITGILAGILDRNILQQNENSGQTPSIPGKRGCSATLDLKKILIVDDDEINREIVAAFLEKAGASTFEASDGMAAIEMVKGQPFDLILMDIEMPGMDGYETTIKIRALSVNRVDQVPIIGLTGHAMEEFKDKCLSSGMNDFLTKPVRQGKLYSTLQHWIYNAGTPANETRTASNPDPSLLRTEKGLYYVNQNQRLYIKMLTTFISSYADFETELGQSFRETDINSIRMLMHKLKSSAKMVGADNLSSLAKKIEHIITTMVPQGNDDPSMGNMTSLIKGKIRRITEELRQVIAAGQRYLDTMPDKPLEIPFENPPETADVTASFANLTANLLEHIKRHLPLESNEILKNIRQQTSDAFIIDKLNQVQKHIDAYRFRDAEILLGGDLLKNEQ